MSALARQVSTTAELLSAAADASVAHITVKGELTSVRCCDSRPAVR